MFGSYNNKMTLPTPADPLIIPSKRVGSSSTPNKTAGIYNLLELNKTYADSIDTFPWLIFDTKQTVVALGIKPNQLNVNFGLANSM